MRYFLFFIFLTILATSCKPPLPIYFDAPIGIKVQGFDSSITGNYVPLKDIIEKGTKEFSEKYTIKYDKILPKDTGTVKVNSKNINDEEIKTILDTTHNVLKNEQKEKNCDSLFKSICTFNKLFFEKIASHINQSKSPEPKVGMIHISYDRILYIAADSVGNNYSDTLLTLNPEILLTKYSGNYFLNYKTTYGWEIMQMELWENNFLSIRPFYFTNYNNCTENISALTASTKNIYPDLMPILNKEKKIIGFKAKLKSKLLKEKFKKSEEVILLLKLK